MSKSFGAAGSEPVLALDRLSLEVYPGELLAVIGPSGCGKSTLLSIVAGLEAPSAGRIELDGRAVTGPGPDRGVCFQDYALFPWKTVRENVEFGLKVRGIPPDRRRAVADAHIELVNLKGFENRYPHQLSGGMRQRCALARLLANDPEILLMDEPLASVDAQTRIILQEEILRIWGEVRAGAERKTVVYVTHSIEEAAFLSDRIAVLTARPGRLKALLENRLPRPRAAETRLAPEYARLCAELWEMMRLEALSAV